MGRRKAKMELIANLKVRNTTYKKRMSGLMKKIFEFSTLCDVDACMISYGPNQGKTDASIKPEIWPQNLNDVERITKRYLDFPKQKSGKGSSNLSGFLDGEKDKTSQYELPKFEQVFIDEPECVRWNDQVNEFSVDQLKQLNSTLGSKIEILYEKIQSMDGEAGMSHEATQIEYPCSDPNSAWDHESDTTTWRSDTMTMQPLCGTRPDDHYLSDHSSMTFNDASCVMVSTAQPMMSTSSFDFGNFCLGGTSSESNFSYTDAMEYPFVSDDQMMMMPSTGWCREMEGIGSWQGTSTDFSQPSIMQPTWSYMPTLMPAPSY